MSEKNELGFIKYRKELGGEIFKYEIKPTANNTMPAGTVEIVNWGTLDEVVDVYVKLGAKIIKVPDHGPSWTTKYDHMFNGAVNFNDPNVSKWDVSHVTSMLSMFNGAARFNQDISGWDVGNVTNMNQMFSNVIDFDQDLTGWNVENIKSVTIAYSNSIPRYSNWSYHKHPIWGTNGGKYEPKENTITAILENNPVGGTIRYEYVEIPIEEERASLVVASTFLDWGNLTDDVKKDIQTSAWNFYNIGKRIKKVPDYAPPGFTDLSSLFMNAEDFNDPNVSKWDVSHVTNMYYMFGSCKKFNQPLGDWDVSSVTNMEQMFFECIEFNQPLGKWNVSKVEKLSSMFESCTNFNQPLNTWDVSSAIYLNGVFTGCVNFDQPLNDWDVSNAVIIGGMFNGCTKFNQPLDKWNVSNCEDFSYIFNDAANFNQDISMWDVSKGKEFNGVFSGAVSFNQDISGWDVGNAVEMDEMFMGAESFDQDLSSWNVSKIPEMPEDFDEDADSWELPRPIWGTNGGKIYVPIEEGKIKYRIDDQEASEVFEHEITSGVNVLPSDALYIVNWGTTDLEDVVIKLPPELVSVPDYAPPYITDFRAFFIEQATFNDPNVSKWDMSHATKTDMMFMSAKKFNQDLSGWDVSNVTSMEQMFSGALNFQGDISTWDVRKVENMDMMFMLAKKFNVDISGWVTSSATRMMQMFFNASNFNQDLSSWDVHLIPEEPSNFSTMANRWLLPKPIWGTKGAHDDPYAIEEGYIKYCSEENGEVLKHEIVPGLNILPEEAIYIINWGTTDLKDVSLQMSNKLVSVPDYAPPYVTHLNKFFSGCDSFNDPNVSKWDVSHITSLNETFSYTGKFNQPLNDWDVSNVTSMVSTFGMAVAFNQPLDKWDVRKVKAMAAMFANARKFNQPLNTWKTESLELIQGMFSSALEFNQDINNFDVSRCWSLSMLFMYAKRFNKPLDKWDVSNVSDFADVFNFCEDFDQNINDWDVSNGEDFSGMFEFTSNFNQPLDKWDMSNADDLYSMFYEAKAFNQDISTWDVTNVEQFDSMFENATVYNQDLSPWCVKHQGSYPHGFNDGADNWTLPKPIWGSCGGKVTPQQGKIQYVSPIESVVTTTDIVEGVTEVPETYRVLDWGYLDDIKEDVTYSIKLPKEITVLPNVEPSYINSMDNMFEGCDVLVGKDLESWNTENITSMKATFKNTKALDADLSIWDVSNVTNMEEMFMNSGIKH